MASTSSCTDELCLNKKRKIQGEDDSDGIFDTFHSKFENVSKLIDAIDRFKSEITGLGAFQIGSCNAADPDNSYCFTKADCALKLTQTMLAFGNFFVDALKSLKKFLKDREIPQDGKPIHPAMAKLLTYLTNTEIQRELFRLKDYDSDTEVTAILASHLFAELSLSPTFTIDERKSNKPRRCPCLKKHRRIDYGDTSIGNDQVWHGYVDLIMEGADVLVENLEGVKEEYVDQEPVAEVKKRFDMNDNSAGSSIVQLAAEAIVYSFYYGRLHPYHKNTLIPSIGISDEFLVFYFYDCINDVLLGSTRFPVVRNRQLNLQALLAVWLVLNHKHLCNGCSLINIDNVPKANFFDKAKSKLNIYKHEIKRGSVGINRDRNCYLDPLDAVNREFVTVKELESL